MSSVDNRIVNMEFNNRQFTQGVADTQKSLQGLDRTLAAAGKADGLSSMGKAADQVSSRFSALQVAGVTAIATITNSAVQKAGQFIKGFSGMSSMADGFSEYELKLGSIQTIMANTGRPLEDVNKSLNELNKYSDKTIYNFGDMTKNIGLFTNAGIGLEDATSMIKGFSNEAAVSGTSAAQAAGAAYQLSQALSAGTIRLMDWRSLTNVGMGNKKMQGSVIEIAEAMGQFKGQAETAKLAQEDFNGSLEKKWLSASVMENYLKIQAGEMSKAQMKNIGLSEKQIDSFIKQQKVAEEAATKVRTWTALTGTIKETIGSGWAQSMEIVIGDFDQATKIFTNVNDAVGPIIERMSENRNKLLRSWVDQGGRKGISGSFKRIWRTLSGIFKAISGAWKEVFPPSGGNVLMTITRAIATFTRALEPTSGTLENIKSVFKAFFSVIKVGAMLVGGIFLAFKALFGALTSGAKGTNVGLMDMIANFADLISGFVSALTAGGKFQKFMAGLGKTLGAILGPLVTIGGAIGNIFGALIRGEGLGGVKAAFNDVKIAVMDFISGIFDGLGKISTPFGQLSGWFQGAKDKIDQVRDSLSKLASPVDKVTDTLSKIGMPTSVSGVRDKAAGALSQFRSGASEGAAKGGSAMASAGSNVAEAWNSSVPVMQAVGDAIGKVFDKIGGAAAWAKKQFSDLFGSYDAIQWASVVNAIFAGGLLLSIKKFTDNAGSFLDTFSGIGENIQKTFTALTDTLSAMQQQLKAQALKAIAIAVGLLVVSLVALSFIKYPALIKGLGAMSVMMGLLVGSLYGLSKVGGDKQIAVLATSMVLISGALINLGLAVAIFGNMKMETLQRGIGALAIVIGILIAAVQGFRGLEGQVLGAGAAIIMMSTAVTMLAGAVLAFGSMKTSVLQKGMGAVAIGIALMAGSLTALTRLGGEKIASAGAAIVMVAGAMVLLTTAVLAFGNMDMKTLAVGIGSIGVVLGLFVLALWALSKAGPAVLMAAGAITMIAVALNVLLPVIITLGSLPFEVVAGGILAIAAAFAVLILAGAGAMVVAPGLMVLGKTVALLGAAMLLAGAGMALFGAGLATLAVTGAAGIAVIIAAAKAFIALIPSIGVQIAAAIVAILETLGAAAPKIRKAMGVILEELLGVIEDNIGPISETFLLLLETAAETIVEGTDILVNAAIDLVKNFLTAMRNELGGIIDLASEVIVEFIQALGRHAVRIANAGADVLIELLDGLTEAVETKGPEIRRAVRELLTAIKNEMVAAWNDIRPTLSMPDFPGKEGLKKGWNATKNFFSGGGDSPDFYGAGTAMAEAIAAGIDAGAGGTLDSARTLAREVASTIEGVFYESIGKAYDNYANASRSANRQQQLADAYEKDAADADRAANKAEKKASKKGAGKADKKKARRLGKAAEKLGAKASRAQDLADRRQAEADRRAEALERAKTFESSDLTGKGDLRKEDALLAASESQRLFDRAKALEEAANKIQADNKKLSKADKQQMAQYRAEAAKQTAQAAQLSRDAARLNQESKKFYDDASAELLAKNREEFETRRIGITDAYAAEVKRRQDEAELENATDDEKVRILQRRAEENEAKAKKENENYLQALAEADAASAAGNQEAAMEALARAEAAAGLAWAATDQAESERKQIEDLKGQIEQSAKDAKEAAKIQPSRTALEDAAKTVDRYTSSLRGAEEAAAAGTKSVQFIQNVNSPKALSASELYRQSKNLLAAQTIKMGANT